MKKIALAVALATVAFGANAALYTNVPGGANTGLAFAYFGNAANPAGDAPMLGEVFSLTSAAKLSSFAFYAIGNTSASFQLNVAEWNPGSNAKNLPVNTVGGNLLTSTINAVDTFNSGAGYTTISFDNIGLNLNAGTKYVAYLTSTDSSLTHLQFSRANTTSDVSGFGIGEAHYSTIPDQGWQLPFSGSGFLSLQYTATTAAVPEPETYALMLAGLGIIGAVARRKSK